jgi:hypothetical protein
VIAPAHALGTSASAVIAPAHALGTPASAVIAAALLAAQRLGGHPVTLP